MDTLLQHKEDKILWSELNCFVNYKPHVVDKTPDCRNCKLLGRKLSTEKDINRRKGLTIDSMREMEYIYKSKAFSIQMKIRAFDAFPASVFLYNSELWTVTTTIKKQINSFQRRMLRQEINIRWPKKISSEDLYSRTKAEPRSKIIKWRRLNWLGHLVRLPKETPARQALEEALQPAKKKKGRPQTSQMAYIY